MNNEASNTIVGRRSLWFGLLGGGTAWMLHLLSAWVIAEFGCVAGFGKMKFADLTVVAWLTIAASILFFGGSLVAALVSRRCMKKIKTKHSQLESHESEFFLARLGFITSGVFAIIILVQSVPIFFFLRDC